ncbi:Venom serine protease Bi-VSP [Folsomia candida]|uniref:Venom serine protease Bi-VSP n=1 Tax=Folsomia candida TaxID=158441 RepID=A0A226EPJ3_FOLCA|nr:Venom serine protease Bi-VSP [Folsomia candida]
MIINSADSIGSPDLQFLSVPVTDTVQCGKSFKANNVTVTELQVCAGGEKGKGSCAGDSGSPLFYPAKTKGKATIRNFQIGIVSFGKHQCAAGNAPVVYTRVKRYLTWILDHIK